MSTVPENFTSQSSKHFMYSFMIIQVYYNVGLIFFYILHHLLRSGNTATMKLTPGEPGSQSANCVFNKCTVCICCISFIVWLTWGVCMIILCFLPLHLSPHSQIPAIHLASRMLLFLIGMMVETTQIEPCCEFEIPFKPLKKKKKKK